MSHDPAAIGWPGHTHDLVDSDLIEAIFTLGSGLPIAGLAVAGDPATSRAAAAALWMARLWGDRPGYACLCIGLEGHLGHSGSYEFGRFT